MKNPGNVQHEKYPDVHHDAYSKTVFGFWLYLLTDFILFGALFATYAVLHDSTFGGPSARQLLHPSFALIQTLILLLSSLTVGLGGASAHRNNKKLTLAFFGITFFLGIIFLWLQFNEFGRLVQSGNGWEKSAFLSAYFTLVGTHAVHMIFAALWVIVLCVPLCLDGMTFVSIRRLTCLKMFWQFLNIIWVFIFSFVYLMGV
jgi:cytochrome o ubiquinol oxidase subunit III